MEDRPSIAEMQDLALALEALNVEETWRGQRDWLMPLSAAAPFSVPWRHRSERR
jgi:hypothetical protein